MNLYNSRRFLDFLDLIVSFLSRNANAITGNPLLSATNTSSLSWLADKVYRMLESARFRRLFNSKIFDKQATLLNDLAVFGQACTRQQCFTWRVLELSTLFTKTELRTALKHGFIHADGYIDIDFVLLKIISRVCVIMSSVMVCAVLAIYLPSNLMFAIIFDDLNFPMRLFSIFVFLVSFSVVTFLAILVMYKIYLSGILPLIVANRFYEERDSIEKLGPRCVFVLEDV